MRNEILDIKDAKRIAVMGGTFDPIHYGHLVAAEAVRQEYNIEKVIFIPTGNPVHKQNAAVSHTEHRYLMTVIATVAHPCFDVSRLEIDRSGQTYTIDTIRQLRGMCGTGTQIYFITGADAIPNILSWKDAEVLLTLCSFIAVTRPGYNRDKLREQLQSIKSRFETRLHFLEVPALAISSTDIRNRARDGKTIRYLLPTEVERYIEKNGLYRDLPKQSHAMAYSEMEDRLAKTLSDERFAHTMGVVGEAAKLADRYGADREKAKTAALLHDCAKGLTNGGLRKYCEENNVKLDEYMERRISLAHSLAGAHMAKNEYGITDEEILNAIRVHTTGAKDMSLLDKIVYLADIIEPNREDFKGLEEIRKLAFLNLHKALIAAVESTIDYNRKKKKEIHPQSLVMLEWLKKGFE